MRIAVVGAGIAGLTSAYLLHPEHEVVVFEADDRPGGHTRTIAVETSEIESDRRVLQPPGKSRLGKALAGAPAFVLDAVSAKGFQRR